MDLRYASANPGWRRWHIVVALPDGRYSLALCGRHPPEGVVLDVADQPPPGAVICKLCVTFGARQLDAKDTENPAGTTTAGPLSGRSRIEETPAADEQPPGPVSP